ncbi:MAG TPA: hypothetical protein VII91_10105 [Bauldia sp.]
MAVSVGDSGGLWAIHPASPGFAQFQRSLCQEIAGRCRNPAVEVWTMTDFYALLKQSILDRGIRDSGDRQEVYAQARRAVVKQLWDYRPPLAADEIDMRVGAYDTAVERIEADLLTAFAKGDVAKPKARPTSSRERVTASESPAVGIEWVDAGPEASKVNNAREIVDQRRVDRRRADTAPGDEDPYRPHQEGVRWAKRGTYERVQRATDPDLFVLPDWLGTPEQAKIRLGAAAIGALFVILVGVAAYTLGTRNGQGVTLPISVRREVSDAATAARIPTDKVKIAQSFTLFDGRDPTVFATTPDNPIGFDSGGGFARVSSSTSAPGVKVAIGPGLAQHLAGQNVRVVIIARSSLESGAAGMRFAYQSGLALSHWQTANLGRDYAAVGMEWRVPAMQTSPSGDFLLIEPGIPGDGTGVDVKSIRIDQVAS